jgi:hypothetical protein
MDRKKRLEKAAKELADLIEKHLDGLSPSEREGKERAFRRAVAKYGNSAKSAKLPNCRESSRSPLQSPKVSACH